MIPDGPLHPEDAVTALLIGLILGAVVGRRRVAGPVVLAAFLAILAERHPDVVPEGFIDRPSPGATLAAATVAGGFASLLLVGRRAVAAPSAALIVAAGCGAVWSTAPDTEAALIGGLLLVGVAAWLRLHAVRFVPVVVAVPMIAAVFGTVGRPDRLWLVLGASLVAMTIGRVGIAVAQRAGIPMTVAPGATSVVTTAPAATTAP